MTPELDALIRNIEEVVREADPQLHDITMGLGTVNRILVYLRLFSISEKLREKSEERAKERSENASGGFRGAFEDITRRQKQEYERRKQYDARQREAEDRRNREQAEAFHRTYERRFRDAFFGRDFRWGAGFEDFEWGQQSRSPPPSSRKPWWIVLGVKESDPMPIVKKAYRRLAMKHHPDRGGKKEDFQEVEAAYREAERKWKTT